MPLLPQKTEPAEAERMPFFLSAVIGVSFHEMGFHEAIIANEERGAQGYPLSAGCIPKSKRGAAFVGQLAAES